MLIRLGLSFLSLSESYFSGPIPPTISLLINLQVGRIGMLSIYAPLMM